MLIKFGARLCAVHDTLRIYKDQKILFLTKIIPAAVTPNQITFLRFILVVSCLFSLLFMQSWWQAAIYVFSYLLDLLDGALARGRNMVTYFGEKFDAFTDRLGHITLYLTVFFLLEYRLFALFYFIIAEIFFIFYLLFEYRSVAQSMVCRRVALQFSVKIILWVILLQEIFFKFY